MKPLTILHMSSEKVWRGGEQQIAYLIEELSKYGVFSIVAARKGSAFEKYCIEKNIKCFSLPFANTIDLKTAWSVRNICSNEKIDIVHMHSSKSHSIAIWSTLMGNKTPLILSRRVNFKVSQSILTKWKYNHPSIRKVICVSDVINRSMKSYLTHPGKVVTIHSGVDVNKFKLKLNENILRKEFNISENAPIVGSVAALDASKDHFTFIDAIHLAKARFNNIVGIIVGDGPLREELLQYVSDKGLKDNIIFTGYRNDVIKLIPAFDIFMMTSREEGLGTSVLDAFAAGVPVIATRAGGIPEMVIDGETGFLSDIGDGVGISCHIINLLTQPGLRQAIVSNATRKLNEFSKEKMAAETMNVYREVAATL